MGIINISQFGIGLISVSQFTIAGFALAQFGIAYSLIAQIGLYFDKGYGQIVRNIFDLFWENSKSSLSALFAGLLPISSNSLGLLIF